MTHFDRLVHYNFNHREAHATTTFINCKKLLQKITFTVPFNWPARRFNANAPHTIQALKDNIRATIGQITAENRENNHRKF